MPLRSQTSQAKPSVIAPTYPADDPEPHQGTTDLCHPQDLDEPDLQLWLALHLPGVHFSPGYHNGKRTEITIYTRSQKATCRLEPDSQGLRAVVQHHGRVWDTVETAWHTWTDSTDPPATDSGSASTPAEPIRRTRHLALVLSLAATGPTGG